MQMLTVRFRHDRSPEQFAAENGPEIARMMATVPGLLWKYWLDDPAGRHCLGVYHFEDRLSAEAYRDSDLLAQFGSQPGYEVLEVKLWRLIVENSTICRAPGVPTSS